VITKEKGLPKANFFHIRKYLAFSLPLIPLGLLRWAVNFSDRYFITHLLSLSQTGIYTVSYTLGNVIFLLSFPIAFVLFPTVSKYWEYKDYVKVKKFLSYATKLLLLFSTPLATMLYFISQPLLDIFLSSEFVAGRNLVFFIALTKL